ncbi:MAG: putative methylcobalamin:homocysteine methyltransferase [Methanoregulaceae archaeon PtaB.Bin056]|nr:MAG: putative methylcobalamin:homocysteine methyltransferase [Methanoregulaceae archaeon PtaB.Bin056]
MDPFARFPPLPTTVVGSFPVERGSGLFGLLDPFRHAVKVAVDAQVRAGIDIISDGQVRGDMIRAFSTRLPGIHGQDVKNKVLPASGAITVSDTRYALSCHPLVKGILTGPTTLSHGLHIATPIYRNREDLARDLAAALVPEAISLERAGVCMLQVDEPILSTGAASLDAGREALSRVTSSLTVPVSLHVCGDLSEVIDHLLSFSVAMLDIECAKSPENLDLFDRRSLHGKRLGVGCVDSSDPSVEPVSVIRERVEHAVDLLGPEALLFDPDCGLRMLPKDAAFGKISHMVAAVREVRQALG